MGDSVAGECDSSPDGGAFVGAQDSVVDNGPDP